MTSWTGDPGLRDELRRVVRAELSSVRNTEAMLTRNSKISIGLAWAATAGIVAGLLGFWSVIGSLEEKYVTREIFELHMEQIKLRLTSIERTIQENGR